MEECSPFVGDQESTHEHCVTCYQTKPCTRTSAKQSGCGHIRCPQKCGAVLHLCKYEDHRLLCPNEKVPCINADHGCPVILTRSQRGHHLEKCPASVIHCHVEWNRWPLFSQEQQEKVPFKLNTTILASEGQLDVALALRDQRMLNESMKLPKRIHRALRNNLTRRFPAVPLIPRSSTYDPEFVNSNDTSHTVSDDDSEAPWEIIKNPPGLSRSVCRELSKGKASRDKPKKVHVNGNIDSDYCNPFVTGLKGLQAPSNKCQKSVIECDDFSIDAPAEADGIADFKEGVSTKIDDIVGSGNVPVAPTPPTALSVSLGLSLCSNNRPRYIAKPKSMYTFLCAQEFRRDEFPWHCKNTHSDIQCGTGWLEVRCPLAEYGCPYSYQNLQGRAGTTVLFSPVLDSFGVSNACDTQNGTTNTSVGFLLQLPFSILCNIANNLDPFSLCNLAITCRLLRDVCCSLLEDHGIVVEQWKRHKSQLGYSWRVAYRRWHFSTHYFPVKNWTFTNHENMSEHLKKCSFNVKHYAEKPFAYVPTTAPLKQEAEESDNVL